MRRILVCGGAGFIGSNFVCYVLEREGEAEVVVLDKLTYAGNPTNLKRCADAPERLGGELPYGELVDCGRLKFVRGDICDPEVVRRAMDGCRWVVNFAAESHVDRALMDPSSFIETDVRGVYVLCEAARELGVERFLQVSTDEVYGEVLEGAAKESDPLAPRNPYAASKLGGEVLALSYFHSHGLPVLVTRGSNTLGPYQYPEKFVPLMTTNALDDEPLPIYGDGLQERDWLYVEDHCAAVEVVLRRGEPGEVYNVGAGNHVPNINVAQRILDLLGKPRSLIVHVSDRPGHDRRYAVDSAKLRALGWAPKYGLDEALELTVNWYVKNEEWWRPIKSGAWREYYERQYGERLRQARRG